MRRCSRRTFLGATTMALATLAVARPEVGPPPTLRKLRLGFSKPSVHLNPRDTAALVAAVGWDGIECPVRKQGTHIVPERAEEDLPKLVEALRAEGKTIEIVTTDIVKPGAAAEKLLRTLARLGLRTYRFGFVRYQPNRDPVETLREFAAGLRDLSVLNRELGLRGGYQNHSGPDYVGATIWELWQALHDLDPATVGLCFDIGQAMVEAGRSWPTQQRLLRSRWLALQVKDFVWESSPDKGWAIRWCPLGQGRVTADVLRQLSARDFAGPIVQHHEHIPPGQPMGELIPRLRAEFDTLRRWLDA
jgi:sugar phosphate isomerase/epimerase